MDNLRLILLFSLAFVVLLLWQEWQAFKAPQIQQAAAPTIEAVQGAGAPGVPAPIAQSGGVPEAPPVPGGDSAATGLMQPADKAVHVVTDLYRMEIDTRGGTIRKVYLNDYPNTLDDPEEKFQLLRPDAGDLFIAQSGLTSKDAQSVPTHQSAVYSVERESYAMGDGSDTLQVDMQWHSDSGIVVTKRFEFVRGSYLVNVQHIVQNQSGKPWMGSEYHQLMRGKPAEDGNSAFMYTYTGGAIFSPEEKFQKISFDDMDEKRLARDIQDGWLGMIQHYFVGAWVPKRGQKDHYFTTSLNNGRYILGAVTPAVSLADGASHQFSTGFVAAPKLQAELAEIATGLDLVVDYGWLTVIAQPIFWLLKWIQSFIGNWGWSIILLTVLIKLAFFKLSETSYRSMANMRKVTPRIQALKDRYGDDKQRLNQAMMDLYKTEKINPLGGCLPILVQIPVFIALYWVLLESVELRQAPFMLWIEDLSVKDPYFILPLIMGVSMFIQQKLNPAPPDPMQAKIMMSLPFVFTIFFAFFPAGLVLYWVINNVLSIAQQWYITRQIENASH
ncbi:MAG: membrane protein insertase YidC [Candidatus Sedimenticola endophacoides]